MTNEQRPRQPQNTFVGQVKPFRPRRSRAADFDDKQFCGKRGNFYSVLRVWVYGASVEYPEVSINLSLSNGAGSAFTQIKYEELESIISFLQSVSEKLLPIYPRLKAEADAILALRKDQDEKIAQMRAMKQFLDSSIDSQDPAFEEPI